MNKYIPLLSLLLLSQAISAQSPELNCGNGRYRNDVFTNVTKTSDLIFGYNIITDYFAASTTNAILKMDFYEPTGDVATKRPLIILMFGGGFIQGTRADLEPICIALAKKGYATATIDYRLVVNNFFNLFTVFGSEALLTDEVVKAGSDLKAAIRFFKNNAATTNTFKIDTTKIILGGASSGSIAALHVAYTDDINENTKFTTAYTNNGGFEGNTDLQAPNQLKGAHNASGVFAFLNIAGGIADTLLIDANESPIYTSQGTADEVVPFNKGMIAYQGFSTPVSLFGGNLITLRANNIGLKNEFFPITNGLHESPAEPANILKIITDGSAFLEKVVCASTLPVILSSFVVNSANCAAVLQWKTATEQLNSHYDIETSTDGFRFNKIATVQSSNAANGADYKYNFSGYRQSVLFRLKMVDKDGRFTYSPVQRFSPACLPAVSVYPNPVRSLVNVSGIQTGMFVQVLGADGRLLFSQKVLSTTMQIPVSSFSNGMLLVQIKDNNGKILSSTKVLKN